jgi:hypothetical protein
MLFDCQVILPGFCRVVVKSSVIADLPVIDALWVKALAFLLRYTLEPAPFESLASHYVHKSTRNINDSLHLVADDEALHFFARQSLLFDLILRGIIRHLNAIPQAAIDLHEQHDGV